MRSFGHTKYTFDDEDWKPNQYQVSISIISSYASYYFWQLSNVTHKSNAEELINAMPVIDVHGKVARCSGVNELGLGHPVQYIQLDKRHKYTPVTCKWCGLQYRYAGPVQH